MNLRRRHHPNNDELLAESKRVRTELVKTAEELERYVAQLNKVIVSRATTTDPGEEGSRA
jgi:hypothetical protein